MLYDENVMNTKLFLKLFLAIVIAGAFLRFSKLGTIPVSLYWDEVAILLDAKSVAATGFDIHSRPWYQLIYPSYGDYKLPVYIWLSSLAVKLFGASNWSVRVISALAGVGTIIVAGQITRLLFKNSHETKLELLQLCVMAVVAFSPWSIIFSRTGFEGHLAQFFLSLSVWMLLLSHQYLSSIFQTKSAFWSMIGLTLVTVIMGTLATYTYYSVRFVWPVVIAIFWLLYWSKYLRLSHRPKLFLPQLLLTLLIPIALFFLTLVPMTRSPLYQISNQFRLSTKSIFNQIDYAVLSNQLREQAGNSTIDRIFFHRNFLLLKELAKNYADHLDLNFIFISGDQNLRHGTGLHGLFLFASLPIFLYGLIKLWLTHKRVWLTLVLWWLIALLPASVPETTPHALRSLNALVPMAIILGFGLAHLLSLSMRKTRHLFWRLLMVGLIVANLINLAFFANHYFNHYPALSAYDWQDGYQELAEVVTDNQDDVSEVWVDGMDGRLYLWIMAYDQQLTATQIQALPKENYAVKEIGKIKFRNFDWLKLQTNHYKILIVGEYAFLTAKINESTVKPTALKEIIDHAGNKKFLIAFFGE